MEETYYQRNRERQLALSKQYREAHRNKFQEYQKNYYASNKDKILRKRMLRRCGTNDYLPPKPKKTKKEKKEKKEPEALTKEEIILELVTAEGALEPSFIRQSGNFIISWD